MSVLLLDAATIAHHGYLVMSVANAGAGMDPAVSRLVVGFRGKALDYEAVIRKCVNDLASANVRVGGVVCDSNMAR